MTILFNYCDYTDIHVLLQGESTRKVIRQLVGADAEVNARDIYGDTPLFFAVLRGNEEAAEELLGCTGVDVDVSGRICVEGSLCQVYV